jgi:hypothetical protein
MGLDDELDREEDDDALIYNDDTIAYDDVDVIAIPIAVVTRYPQVDRLLRSDTAPPLVVSEHTTITTARDEQLISSRTTHAVVLLAPSSASGAVRPVGAASAPPSSIGFAAEAGRPIDRGRKDPSGKADRLRRGSDGHIDIIDMAIVDRHPNTMRYVGRIGTFATKRRLMDAIRRAYRATRDGDEWYASVGAREMQFESIVHFLANYGFVDARVDVVRADSVSFAYTRRVPIAQTLARAVALVVGMARDVYTLKLCLGVDVARAMSDYLRENVERGGPLFITHYDGDGVAYARIDPTTVAYGDPATDRITSPPQLYRALGFHTHADAIMRRHDDYIAFPSGRDIASIVDKYLFYRDELVEFIASPEGVWFVHISVPFQRVLRALKARMTRELRVCCTRLIDDIAERASFAADQKRVSNAPIARLSVDAYLARVNAISIATLFANRPPTDDLVVACRLGSVEDAHVVDVGFVQWDEFADGSGVRMAFSYVLDTAGGLPAIIEPEP